MSQKTKAPKRPHIPMTFRLVARDGKWEVETAVKPHEGMELQFVVDKITGAGA